MKHGRINEKDYKFNEISEGKELNVDGGHNLTKNLENTIDKKTLKSVSSIKIKRETNDKDTIKSIKAREFINIMFEIISEEAI